MREQLRGRRLRVELDERSESVGRKIREAELRKIPYMLIVGEREAARAGRCRCASTARATRASVSVEGVRRAAAGELYSAALKPRKSSERHA